MNRLAWCFGALVILPFAVASAATDSPPRQPAASAPIFKVLKIGKTNVIEIQGTNNECEPDKVASCKIQIQFGVINGKKYCVAEAPNVKGPKLPKQGNADNIKFIVWHLDKNDEDNRLLSFHASAGIVITTDDKEKFVVDNSGGHGDANGNGGKSVYHLKVKRNIEARPGYLPIVMWGEGEEAELCAAPDPKIINE